MILHTLRVMALLAAGAALTGCGGDSLLSSSSSSSSSSGSSDASPGGIWTGTDPLSSQGSFAIVTESGEFAFYLDDNSQYYGTLTTAGDSISGSFIGGRPVGETYTDGSTYGDGTISGTVQQRSSLSGTMTFTTAGGTTATPGSLSMSFDTLYNSGSSLGAIAGNYTASDGSTLTIDSNGVVFNQTAAGCVINGQVSLIDASYDAYRISYTFASCTGTTATLNGTTAMGLGTLDTNASPHVMYAAVHDQTAHYILTASYTKQ